MSIVRATQQRRFQPPAVRIDATVIDWEVKYPTDVGLTSHAAGMTLISGTVM
jgi:hypothetical protein